MIYKFEYNKYRYILVKTIFKLTLIILSIMYSLEIFLILLLVYNKYYKFFYISIKVFLLESFIFFILQSVILIIFIKKIIRPFYYSNMSGMTFGFLGMPKVYTECFVKIDENNNEFFTVFNENIENKIYYDEIKKIYSFRKFLIIKYNKKAKIILPNINLIKEKIKTD